MTERPTRRQQRKQSTAQHLFDVAVGLFLSQGYAATTIEAITRAAGVAKGTFFNHFPSKVAVLRHLGQMQVTRLHDALAANDTFSALPVDAQVRFIYHTLGAGIEGRRDLVRLTAVEILGHAGEFNDDLHGITDFDRILLPIVRAAQGRGELRGDRPAELLAATIRAVYFLVVFEWLRHTHVTFAEVADQQLDLLLDGLRGAPAARGEHEHG